MWRIVDSGRAPGPIHMEADRIALNAMMEGAGSPTLRFFQWDQPTISYGYLLDLKEVQNWATQWVMSDEKLEVVQRPTGGGAVYHKMSDLSFSLLWQRGDKMLPDNPRACYAKIHSICKEVLGKNFELYTAPDTCERPSKKFSACFSAPVCNDVMMGDKKIIGGALRITKQAMLYQGTIQLGPNTDLSALKNNLLERFQALIPQAVPA